MTIQFHHNELMVTGMLTQNTVTQALAESLAFMPKNNSLLVVNLSAVTHCDSASLAFLMSLVRVAKKNQIVLKFTHMPKQMRDLSLVSGIDNFLPIA
ncbi:MAG: lipid asymmetry maintenance protein MlaB [Candidatus Berkiellales bacterium]